MVCVKSNALANVPRSSKGRKKIEIKKIDNKSSQQVTFSKRRAGLFKKAAELCILCGSQVGIIVFSPVHKIFSFGHPHIDTVIHRYLHGDANPEPPVDCGNVPSIHAMNQQYEEAQKKLVDEKQKTLAIEAEKNISLNDSDGNRNNNVRYWWDEPIRENIEVEELEQYMEAIEQLMKKVAAKADDMMMRPFLPLCIPAVSINEGVGGSNSGGGGGSSGGGSGSEYCFSGSQSYNLGPTYCQ